MRAVAITILVSRIASADTSDVVARPIVLADDQVLAQLVVEADLATFAQPLSIAPDAWLGATDKLTVGVVHSDAAIDRIDDGASVCFSCTQRRYHDVGVDARYAISDELAPRVRVLVRDVSPWKPALAIGALARWQHGRFAITGDPYLQLGLANTDRGNRAALNLPVFFSVQPACGVAITLVTGYASDLAVWSDGYHVPAALEVTVRATAHVDLGVEAGFPSLAGPQNQAKEREAWFVLAWRS